MPGHALLLPPLYLRGKRSTHQRRKASKTLTGFAIHCQRRDSLLLYRLQPSGCGGFVGGILFVKQADTRFAPHQLSQIGISAAFRYPGVPDLSHQIDQRQYLRNFPAGTGHMPRKPLNIIRHRHQERPPNLLRGQMRNTASPMMSFSLIKPSRRLVGGILPVIPHDKYVSLRYRLGGLELQRIGGSLNVWLVQHLSVDGNLTGFPVDGQGYRRPRR